MRAARRLAGRRRSGQAGQATVEYVSITTLLIVGAVTAAVGWPYTKELFDALQHYVDLYFYALNLALG